MDEQSAELNAMLAEFHDLERKHQLIKEQYEAEIMRLKGQAPPPLSAAAQAAAQQQQQKHAQQAAQVAPTAMPATQLPHASALNAAAAANKRRPGMPDASSQIPPYSATLQGDQQTLPVMFASRGMAAHPQGHSTQPGQQGPQGSAQPGQPGQPGAPVRLMGISGLPPAGVPPSGNPSAIPAMNPGGPSALSRPPTSGLSGKMPSMSLMPPNGTTQALSHGIKKDPTIMGPGGMGVGGLGGGATAASGLGASSAGGPGVPSSGPAGAGGAGGAAVAGGAGTAGSSGPPGGVGPGPGGSGSVVAGGPGGVGPGGNASFASAAGRGGMMKTTVGNQIPGVTQTTNEDDWVVYHGRSANGSVVNMNVTLQNSLSLDSVVCCVRYSWDGNYLATGSNRCAHIFDANTGQGVATFSKDSANEREEGNVPDSYVRAVCFSPDGNWLITGAEDHVVKVWDVRNRKVKHRLVGHGTDIYSVDASANGHFIISGSGDKKAKLWGLESGKLLSTLGGEFGPTDGITSVSVSPTSQHVAAGSLDKIVRVWDVETSRLVRQFEGHRDSVYSVAFSPDGRMLLSGSLDKTLKLWDLAASQPASQCRLSFTGHKDFVLSVAFSPSGRWLISGSKDRTVQFWDPRQSTMCVMLQGHKNSVISIAHNPGDKSLATGSGDCRARTWTY